MLFSIPLPLLVHRGLICLPLKSYRFKKVWTAIGIPFHQMCIRDSTKDFCSKKVHHLFLFESDTNVSD